ncbi:MULTISPECIES: hypothetical protein [Hafnia]|nr:MULTISPECIES: hypothetical protein [Hafnia]AJQ98195.1 hypothetical protein F652_205 [Enterobacteriaceae bacterium bta3-1]MDU1191503.1 hypothetical protein [Enterobacteriaceae bacterium]MBU2671714.1 hypothetical protein [Hafnia paralvei]MBW2958873.1 hypothetical protein [Hafnia paralvei]MCE9880286.1 hypothetical protein [Hafnia paralvei]
MRQKPQHTEQACLPLANPKLFRLQWLPDGSQLFIARMGILQRLKI